MKKWRILLACFAVLFVFAIQTPKADAATVNSGSCGQAVTWQLDTAGVLTISGNGAMQDFNYNTATKETDIPWFENRSSIEKIVVQAGVTRLGKWSFHSCENLTEVVLPEGLTDIPANCFWLCTSVKQIDLPTTVKTLGSSVFYKCGALERAVIPAGVTVIPASAFYQCAALTFVELPNTVTSVGDSAFRGCNALKDVTFNGTPEQWNAVYVAQYNTKLTGAQFRYGGNVSGWVTENGVQVYYENGVKVTNAWRQDAEGWYYLGENASKKTNSWLNYYGYWYYFDGQGYMVADCWRTIGGYSYCFNADGVMLSEQWIKVNGQWTYVNASGGKVVNSWLNYYGYWYYFDGQGYMLSNCWRTIGGYTYRFNADGIMLTGQWFHDGSGWTYIDDYGVRLANAWKRDGYGWCYLGSNGYMAYNTLASDGYGICYVDATGYMVTDRWVAVNGGWCYIGSSGYMVTDTWINSYGCWYYLDSQGYMLSNCWCTIGGYSYRFNADGIMLAEQWVYDGYGWAYVNGSGICLTNAWKRDGYGWCYLGADGYMVTNTWQHDGYGWCYIDDGGHMISGCWLQQYSLWYYIGANGYMVANDWVNDGGCWYYMGADGVMLTNCEIGGGCIGSDGVWNSGHSWIAATCTSPKHCGGCGKTQGSTTGHNWQSATCTTPKTCSVCKATSGSATGHSYYSSTGKCRYCGEAKPVTNLVAGQKWTVAGEWEFTITSVTLHSLCNSYSNSQNGYTNQQVVLINYTYKNIGYVGNTMDLYFGSPAFTVYDGAGYSASTYACTHDEGGDECVYGTSSSGSTAYVLSNYSTQVMIHVEKYGRTTGTLINHEAMYTANLSGSGTVNTWTNSELNSVMQNVVNAISDAYVAESYAKFATSGDAFASVNMTTAKTGANSARSSINTALNKAIYESDLSMTGTYSTLQDALQAVYDDLNSATSTNSAYSMAAYLSSAITTMNSILNQFYYD